MHESQQKQTDWYLIPLSVEDCSRIIRICKMFKEIKLGMDRFGKNEIYRKYWNETSTDGLKQLDTAKEKIS